MSDKKYTIEIEGTVHRLIINNAKMEDSCEFTAKIDRAKTAANLVVEGKVYMPTIRF